LTDKLTILEKILFLKRVHLFSKLSARDLHLLAQEATEMEVARGSHVFRAGDEGDALYVIVEGHAGIILEPDHKVVNVLQERECFGEIAVLTHERRTASVEALSALALLRISRADFRHTLLSHPHMAFSIFEILAERIKSANSRVGGAE
jgi:CRP-like cAMP-binding protein